MRIIIVLIVFLMYTFLFKKAAGTLNILRLNMINFVYYLSLVFGFIGASIVFCGFRDHYLIIKVTDEVIDKTYMIFIWSLIVFPLSICIFNKIFGVNHIKEQYNSMINSRIYIVKQSNVIWVLMIILSIISILSIIYVFNCIGFFTPVEFLKSHVDDTLAKERIEITKSFEGNIYIRNILMLTMTPILSYITYIYMRLTKHIKWKALFIILFICSISVKVYNFEKSPVIWYLFYFYILEILLGNVKNIKYLIIVGAIGLTIILGFYYILFDYQGKLFSISSGPGGRIFMTQIATLFLHVQAFPNISPYLNGTSLPSIYAILFDLNDSWRRSGSVIMKIFAPSSVANGTAGVMNTFFIGEAYANWGIVGVILAPIYIAFLYSLVNSMFLKLRKTPLSIICYLVVFISFSQSIIGGFIDYLYPLQIIIMVTLILVMSIAKNGGKLRFIKFRE